MTRPARPLYSPGMRAIFNRTVMGLLAITFLAGGCLHPYFARKRAVRAYVSAVTLQQAAFDEDAIIQLHEAVRLNPEFSLAHSMLGSLYRKNNQYEKAAVAYEVACMLDPWAFEDHYNLGYVYKVLKKFTEAIRILKRACQLQPDHPEANYTLAVCYYETKNYTQAAKFCSRAAKLSPNNEKILVSMGDIYGKMGDSHEAVNAYKQALELNPYDTDIMRRLGLVYVRMKRFGPASNILQKSIAAAPTNPDMHLAMGYCYLTGQKLQMALEAYRRAAQLDRKNHQAFNGMGVTQILLYRQNPQDHQLADEAIKNWNHSLEINPNQPKIKRFIVKYTKELYPPAAPKPPMAPSK